jgi:hypothetical protein
MKAVLLQINFHKGSASTMSVTYTSVLPVRDDTVELLAGLLAAERLRRGTRAETRSLSCHDQAVLVLRWFLDGTWMSQLARGNAIGKSTGYDYLHEADRRHVDERRTRAVRCFALREAGATRVSVLVVVRWLKEDYGGNKQFIADTRNRDFNTRICLWTRGSCPNPYVLERRPYR